MASIDHTQPAKEAPPPPVPYQPAPGDMITTQNQYQAILYESQSMVHDGRLPQLNILEQQIKQKKKGTGTQTSTEGDETFKITLAHGKRVEASVVREDGSSDVAHYHADGSLDEDLVTAQGKTHRHYGPHGQLLSEEHEGKTADNSFSADHLEYDAQGNIRSSDISVINPATGETDRIHDQALAKGGGLFVEKSADGDKVLLTKPDGSTVSDAVDPDGTKVHEEIDPAGKVLFTDTTDPVTGKIIHAVPQPDGTIKETEQRQA